MSFRPVAAAATRASPRATAIRPLHPLERRFTITTARPPLCPVCLQHALQLRRNRPRRWFHATAPRHGEPDLATKNHYERLGVRYDASPPEIKKSFYALSKAYHPDTSPRPNAAHTFSLLSESYTVLSDPRRRAAYDRDVLRLHDAQSPARQDAAGAPPPRGSYSSTTTRAGGRAASGLSKRRGTFRGPPPSFYRSGGWGAQAEKRRAAHEESTGGATSTQSSSSSSSSSSSGSDSSAADGTHGGMGPGADPFGHHDEVPHFDKHGHRRTQGRQDERRWQRAKRAMDDDGLEFEPQMSLGAHFLVVSAILAVTVMAPMAYLNMVRSGRKKDER